MSEDNVVPIKPRQEAYLPFEEFLTYMRRPFGMQHTLGMQSTESLASVSPELAAYAAFFRAHDGGRYKQS